MTACLRSTTRLFLLVWLTWCVSAGTATAQDPPDAMAKWAVKVQTVAPASPTQTVDGPRQMLMFSLATGYQHSVIPYVDRAIDIIGSKSHAYTTTITRDIEDLTAERLAAYDILALNNTCSKGSRRDLLLDVLETDKRYKTLTPEQRATRARTIERAMLDFVKSGKGLVVIHGAPTLLNNSPEFTAMVGGAFDYHPPAQPVKVRVVDPDHPLCRAFRDTGPLKHRDEPYCFKGTYNQYNFRPLLQFDAQGIVDKRGKFASQPRYSAWIKRYGKGRVFYCSPGHFPETYEQPAVLQFVLDGIQYAAGDLSCPDTPPETRSKN